MPTRQDKLTFLGLPRWPFSNEEENRPARPVKGIVWSVESGLGATHKGCENASFFMRRISQRYVWQAKNPTVVDLRQRNIDFNDFADAGSIYPDATLEALTVEIERFIEALPVEAVPITIGGDHSISLPVVRVLKRKMQGPLTVVSFDHHMDIQHWGENLDELYHTNVMSHISQVIGDGNLMHIGINPYQTVDEAILPKFLNDLERIGRQIPIFSKEIENDEAVSAKVGEGRDIYITIDVDVLEKSVIQSTGYPSSFGLSLDRLCGMIAALAKRNRIVGCDIVEFSAEREDRSKQTLADGERVVHLLLELMSCVAQQPLRDQS